jgi:hypothetical protein
MRSPLERPSSKAKVCYADNYCIYWYTDDFELGSLLLPNYFASTCIRDITNHPSNRIFLKLSIFVQLVKKFPRFIIVFRSIRACSEPTKFSFNLNIFLWDTFEYFPLCTSSPSALPFRLGKYRVRTSDWRLNFPTVIYCGFSQSFFASVSTISFLILHDSSFIIILTFDLCSYKAPLNQPRKNIRPTSLLSYHIDAWKCIFSVNVCCPLLVVGVWYIHSIAGATQFSPPDPIWS